MKESLKYGIDRTTYADKMRDFQKWMVAVKKDTLYRVSVFSLKNSFKKSHKKLLEILNDSNKR